MPDFKAVPTTLYLDRLDNYVRRWLKNHGDYATSMRPLDQVGGETELQDATLEIAEALMLSDGVALTTTGENAGLAFLIRMFGAHPTAELIRRDIISFVGLPNATGTILTPSDVKLADGSPAPPGNPITVTFKYDSFEPAMFNNESLDVDAASITALRRYQRELGIADREVRELGRRSAKRTHAVPAERLADTTKRVQDAYASGALESLGLSPHIARRDNVYQDNDVARLIASLARTEIILELELDQYQVPEEWSELRRFTTDVACGPEVLRSSDNVMAMYGFADLKSLFRDRILHIRDIPKLRDAKAARDFRRWLWSQPDPSDAQKIAEDFIREIAQVDADTATTYARKLVTIVAVTIAQDYLLDAAQLTPEARIAADVGIAVGGLLNELARKAFRRRPPSAFFDKIVLPAAHRGRQTLATH